MRLHARLASLAVPVVLALPSSAAAGEFRLVLNGAFDTTRQDFNETRTFREFAEDGQFRASYAEDAAFGFDVGAQYNFTPRFGVYASFAQVDRDGSVAFEADLPHPFFFDRDRQASGSVATLGYKERQVHVDLAHSGSSGSLRFNLFGGVTFFKVEADLIDRIAYDHSYPYDSVTLLPTPTLTVEDGPTGFNVGAGVDFKLSPRVAVGVQGRFSRATAKLAPSEGNTVEIDAGGFQAAGGIRFTF